jgi:hypothetical protein
MQRVRVSSLWIAAAAMAVSGWVALDAQTLTARGETNTVAAGQSVTVDFTFEAPPKK